MKLDSEQVRQKSIDSYLLSDNSSEKVFDNITLLASQISNTPISVITFLQENTHVIKSYHGFKVDRSPIVDSFYSFAIQNPDEVMIIGDARKDAKFNQSQFVTDDSAVVFYAGIALVNGEGLVLGSLGVMDKLPRKLNDSQIDSLKALANQVVQLLELRKKQNELRQFNETLKKESSYFRKRKFFFRTLVENGANGVIVLNEKMEFQYVSPTLEKILGYTPEEAMSMNLIEFAHPDDIPVMSEVIERAFANPGVPIEGSTSRIKHKDGSWRWLDAVITNMLHDPSINGIVDNFRDVTDKVLADLKLESSEKRFKSLVQDGSDLIGILDIEANYTYVSPTSIKILGISPESFIGTNAFDYIHPDDVPIVMERFQSAKVKKHVSIQPFRFKNGSGKWRWIETVITNLTDDPTVEGFVVNSRDVTDKVLKEREFELFNQITSDMAGSERFENRLLLILSNMTDFLDVDCGEVWIVSSDQKTINKVAHYARSEKGNAFTQNQQISTIKKGEGVLGFIWEKRKHLFIEDLSTDTRFMRKDLAQTHGIIGLIAIPIIFNDDVIGVFSFFTRDQIKISKETINSLIQTTQRLTTEISRLISEQELINFLNLSPGVLSVLSSDGLIIKINSSFELEMGHDIGSLIGTSLYDHIPEDAIRATKSALESTDTNNTFKNKFIKKDGNIEWLEWQTFKTKGQGIIYAAAKNITRQEELSRLIEVSNEKARYGTWEVDLLLKRSILSNTVQKIHEIKESVLDLEDAFQFYKEGEHQDYLRQSAKDLIEGKINSFDIEVILVTRTGKELWVNVIAEPEFKEGICQRLYGSIQDIDEKKRTELQIKDVNTRYMLATKTTRLGVWDWDIITDQLTWDDGMLAIYEIERGQFEGGYHVWLKKIHQEDREQAEVAVNNAFRNKEESYESNFRIVIESGKIKYIDAAARIIYNDDNKPVRIIGINRDITEIKQYEEELTLANYEKSEILESINDGFYTLDENWIVTYWNKAAEEMLVKRKEDILGKSIWEAYTNASSKFKKEFENAFEKRENRSFEEYYPKLDMWFQINAYPKKKGLTVLFKDITRAQKLKERLLENSIRSMEKERNRIALELHDGIVQEIVAAMMQAEYISSKLKKGETTDPYMPNLIDLLRKASNDTRRLSHNLRSPELEKLTLIELIEKLIDQMNNVSSISFYLDIEDELNILVFNDAYKTNIFRVVQELVANITKHSGATSARIQMKVSEKSKIILTVEDNGIGLDLSKPNKYQGIGMINMRERIQELNGSIEVVNIKPQGLKSTITINTPYYEENFTRR